MEVAITGDARGTAAPGVGKGATAAVGALVAAAAIDRGVGVVNVDVSDVASASEPSPGSICFPVSK